MTKSDPLAAQNLMTTIQTLAGDIGPRPPGSDQERQARSYIHQTLNGLGIQNVEEIPFSTNDTWGYSLIIPNSLAILGNLIGWRSRFGKTIGGLLSLFSGYSLWRLMNNESQLFFPLYPKRKSASLVARLTPTGPVKERVVLIGHTDTNKHRLSFSPAAKKYLVALTTFGLLNPILNGLAQFAGVIKNSPGGNLLQRLTFWNMLATLGILLNDERYGFIDGANDNATAVACVLGLGAHLHQNPLQHTEVWLAFTGAEETGLFGTHALLDRHSDTLRDAWFIDFEMVGSDDITYITDHSSLSHLMTAYEPDLDSLQLAFEASHRHPKLDVKGRPMVINDEVAALRRRGYRGICLAGVGPDGYLENWHQHSDTVANIKPAGVEKAARFALAMLQTLDER